MRISDWSSDVCSSDLPHYLHIVRQIAGFGRVDQAGQHERGWVRYVGAVGGWKQAVYCQVTNCLRNHQRHAKRRKYAIIIQLLNRPSQRSDEHTSELQSLMRISYASFCLKNTTH